MLFSCDHAKTETGMEFWGFGGLWLQLLYSTVSAYVMYVRFSSWESYLLFSPTISTSVGGNWI